MPEFTYEALTPNGAVESGIMTAEDERSVEDRLRELGQFLVSVRVAERPPPPKRTDGKIERKQLIGMLEYLAGAAQVGTPILTTLLDVEGRLESKKLRKIIAEMRNAMSEEGKSLSQAMAEHPQAFAPYYISTLEAGEASGQLDFVLQQLVEHLDWQETIASQMKQATMYPIIVLTAIGGLITVLVGFVFPRLIPVLTSRNVELPLATRMVMFASTVIREHWLIAIVSIGAVVILLRLYRRTETGRKRTDALLLRSPIFGDLILQVNMARMVTYLALFYRTGVEIIYSLELVQRLITNKVVAGAVGRARELIISGETIATAFARSPVFPPMILRSIALGESTGHLDEALGRATAYYAREVPAAVRRFITILQPVLIAFMGGVVLLVALAIILPILGIYSSIGRR